MKTRFNERWLARLELPTDTPQAYFWDTETQGLGVVVGKTGRKTFVARGRVNGEQRKVTIGVAGQPRDSDGHVWNVQLARAEAKKLLGAMAEGKAPAPLRERTSRSDGPTLSDALELHRERMKREGKQPRSIEEFLRETEKHLDEWLKRPLSSITRTECRELHAELSDASGVYLGNRVMRFFRAAWNTTLKEHEGLSVCPTIAVYWNKEHRRQEPIPWAKLPDWWTKVHALENGVRRDYYLLLLFTGLRKMDAATIRWEHVNLTAKPRASQVWNITEQRWRDVELPPRSLLHPSPKGGADRAFTLPLSKPCLEILERRRDENVSKIGNDDGWAFPTETWKADECHACAALGQPAHSKKRKVHIIEPREEGIVSPHRLRDTYTTALAELRPALSAFTIDVLTNHRSPRSSVTPGYVDISLETLAKAQERVAQLMVEKAKPERPLL
jgi:integrase